MKCHAFGVVGRGGSNETVCLDEMIGPLSGEVVHMLFNRVFVGICVNATKNIIPCVHLLSLSLLFSSLSIFLGSHEEETPMQKEFVGTFFSAWA